MDLAEFLLDRIGEELRRGRESWPGENKARWHIAVGCKQMISANVGGVEVYERMLRQLASRYTDHPDYRTEWCLIGAGCHVESAESSL